MRITHNIPALTGIRAIAALMVVIHHLVGGKCVNEYYNSIIRELNIGVNIFFVLSGFLIWSRYADNFELNRKWINKYLVNRIARIYPVYFFLTSAVMILTFITQNLSIRNFVFTYFLNITFLKGFSSEYIYSGISQGWTLSVEALFYLTAPILFVLNIRKKISFILLGLIIIIGFGLYFMFVNIDFYGFFNNLQVMKITTYFGRFTEFFAGILLAKHINSSQLKNNKNPMYTTLGVITIIISVCLILPNLQTSDLHYSIQTNIGYLFNVLILPIFVVILFYGLITEPSALNKLLSSKPFIILGKSSYTLYLLHWGMTSYVINRFISGNIYITIFITYILSIILWKYFEEPANNYIRRKYN